MSVDPAQRLVEVDGDTLYEVGDDLYWLHYTARGPELGWSVSKISDNGEIGEVGWFPHTRPDLN